MKFLSKAFTASLLSLFGIFIASPIFAGNVDFPSTLVVASSFSDTCSWNIECDALPDGLYICRTTGESLSAQGGMVQFVPVGKYSHASVPPQTELPIYSLGTIQEKKNTYTGPDTFVYPFVRIIKIQV